MSQQHPARRRGRDIPPPLGDSFEEVWNEWGTRRTTTATSYDSLLYEVYRRARVPPNSAAIGHLVAERALGKRAQLIDIEQPVLDMLDALRSAGVMTAVASGCAIDDVVAWSDSPLSGRIDVTAFSFLVGPNKPDIRIFLATARMGDEL